MNSQRFYGKRPAPRCVVQVIRQIPPDSEESELSSDDNDDEYVQPQQPTVESSSEDEHEQASNDEDEEQPSTSKTQPHSNRRKLSYSWKKASLDQTTKQLPFTGNADLPPDILELKTPLQFFHCLFTPNLEALIVEQCNLFAVQTCPNKSLNVTVDELQQFLGIVMWMSIVKLPSARKY